MGALWSLCTGAFSGTVDTRVPVPSEAGRMLSEPVAGLTGLWPGFGASTGIRPGFELDMEI